MGTTGTLPGSRGMRLGMVGILRLSEGGYPQRDGNVLLWSQAPLHFSTEQIGCLFIVGRLGCIGQMRRTGHLGQISFDALMVVLVWQTPYAGYMMVHAYARFQTYIRVPDRSAAQGYKCMHGANLE